MSWKSLIDLLFFFNFVTSGPPDTFCSSIMCNGVGWLDGKEKKFSISPFFFVFFFFFKVLVC